MTRTNPLPCFKCDKPLESVFASIDKATDQPADAVMFYSYGQYGSTAFDPMDDSQLQINICDDCLIKNKDRVWHARYVRREPQEIFSGPWNPHKAQEGGAA